LSQNRQYQSNWIDDDDDLWDPLTDEIEDEMRDLVDKNQLTLDDGIPNDRTLDKSESSGILDDDERTLSMKAQIVGFQIQDGSLWI
jgi:hypothetical protein